MHSLLRTLYVATAKLAGVASQLAPAGGGKTALAFRARRGIRERYARWAAGHRDGRPLLWMHAPSVGEGLMARPVLSLLRARRPDIRLAYTFFSPSAAPFAQKLDVDFTDYIPFDAPGDMAAALDALRPRALVFSKLDVWPELVREARRRGVALGMISASLAAGSSRRGGVARTLLRDAYASLDAVGASDAADADRLVQLGVRREVLEVTGDTRYDQVLQRVAQIDRTSPVLAALDDERPTLVAGSTWPADEGPLLTAFAALREHVGGARLVIAPHEPTASHLQPIESWARTRGLGTARLDAPGAGRADVVLVDRVGILADLYAVADLAFVGGGFHAAGLHSVVEPAALGVPVLFGPRHSDSRDAALLIEAGAGASVANAADIQRLGIRWLTGEEGRDAGRRARAVVERGRGAAERSVRLVERLLTA